METTKTELKIKMGEILMAATREPVKITSYGKPSHVIVDIAYWEKLMRELEDAKRDVATKPNTPSG